MAYESSLALPFDRSSRSEVLRRAAKETVGEDRVTKNKPLLQAALKTAYYVALAGAGVGAWLVRLDPDAAEKYAGWVRSAAAFARDHSWLVVGCPIIAAIAKGSLELLERQWLAQIVHSLLTDYRATVFGSLPGAKHHHRVTLFVHRRFSLIRTLPWNRNRKPWSGWLVPISRSDHTTQKMRTKFLAPDHADNSEGVAGSTWSHQETITVKDLPRLHEKSTDAEILQYCNSTKCNESWIRKRLKDGEKLPLSLRGMPVEVNDTLWGVVVLDSREADGFSADPHGTANFTLIFLSTLGRLMERSRV